MTAPLAKGAIFADRYCVVRRIAQGGMGAVYEVLHIETNRRRALKTMHPHLFENDDMRDRFKREARVAAEIESEHIVDVFDAGVEDTSQTPFLVMELLRGEELGKRVRRLGRLPPAEVLTYLRQTALALDKTHAAAIVHRDLKPDNLFLTHRDDGSPRIKILDFGVAKVVAEGSTGQGTQSVGTPMYMAPEQFHPGAKITFAADVFALGLVAFTLLVGAPYWRPESASGVVAFILVAVSGPKISPVERAAGWGVTLPPAFDPWFFKATAFDPEKRFGTASEAVAAFEQVFAETIASEYAITTPIPRVSAPSLPAIAPPPPDSNSGTTAESGSGESSITTSGTMFGSTSGTFVPTELPPGGHQRIVPSPRSSEATVVATPQRRRSAFVAVNVAAGAILIFVLWWALRGPTPIPNAVHAEKSVPGTSTNLPSATQGPSVTPVTNLVGTTLPAKSVEAVALPAEKPTGTVQTANPVTTPATATVSATVSRPNPSATATTKKTKSTSLIGQD